MTSARRAEELLERGYTVFEGLYTDEEVSRMREPIARRYEALGSPPTFARPPLEPAPGVEISIVGLIFHKLGAHAPELAPLVLRAEVAEAARAVLGENTFLEYTAAVVNHGERPFFPWHAHMGGVDNAEFRKGGLFPRYEASDRVTGLIYLDDLTDDVGALLVHPRRISDETRPPHEPTQPHWPGQVELPCRRGTVVLLEQCTWHAARPKRSPGLRAFIAFYLTSARAAPPSWVDDSFRAHAAAAPVLASLLPAR